MDLLTTGSNFVAILVGFCLLIVIHELGHFLAARWAGIRVDGFAIGLGPTVASFRRGIGLRLGSSDRETERRFGCAAVRMSDGELARNAIGETEYSLRLLPLGGFVKMLGQEDANPSAVSDSPRSYQSTPVWKRMVVVSAGVVANAVLAVVLFLVAFLVGVRFPAPLVGFVGERSPAANAVAINAAEAGLPADAPKGIQPGDRVVAIDGEPILSFNDIMIAGGLAHADVPLIVTVARPGITTPLEFSIVPKRDPGLGLLSIGLGAAGSTTITEERDSRATVTRILDESGLAAHGVVPGMRLVAVGDTSVVAAQGLDAIIANSAGAPLTTHWESRDGVTVTAPLALQPEFQLYRVADRGAGESAAAPAGSNPTDIKFVVERGLAGLVPLIRVDFVDPSSANRSVLVAGDVLIKVGTVDAPSFSALRAELARHTGSAIDVVVLRDGREVRIPCTVDRKGRLGFAPGAATSLTLVATALQEVLVASDNDKEPLVPATTSATGIDVFPRSQVVSVAGLEVSEWRGIRDALQRATHAAKETASGAEVAITIAPPFADSVAEPHVLKLSAADVAALHRLGWTTPLLDTFDPEFVTLKASGPTEAIVMGLTQTKRMALQVYLTLDRVIRRSVSIDQLNGPVGILHAGVKVADQGLMFSLFFLAAISVNLAVMNFLPLPIVDGGLFLFLVYEKFRGRPPSIAFQNAATAVGLMLIGSIFLITFFNDLRRLVG
ncbi:MAG: site-2 protease family protein [Phycisphaerae bacterium]|nr:site-2 protease family protein [Phycisphaerae bacterium]